MKKLLVTLLILVALAGSIYLALTVRWGGGGSPTQVVRTRTMSSSVMDASGKSHTIEARMAFELDRETGGGINQTQLEQAIQYALNGIDYDLFTASNDLSYVKDEVMEIIRTQTGINADAITGIYVTDFASDFYLPAETLPNTSRNDEIFNGLFGNKKR